ncbi:MAG: class I SAM-dependent methyltransferase [Candidatus Brocadiales bacterium]
MKELERIEELSWAYWKSQIIFAGVELGVFDILAQGAKPSIEAAQELRTDPRATEMLLNAMVSLGLLKKNNRGRYSNTPTVSQYLVKGTPLYQGARIHHMHNLWDRWARLQQAVRTGKSVVEDVRADPKRLEDFMASMHNSGIMKARLITKKFSLRRFTNLLDLGGGPGAYSIEFVRTHPGLTATVFDLSDNIKIAKRFIKEAGLEGRVRTKVGDCLEVSLGREAYDVVFVSNLVHIYAPKTNIGTLKKCYKALKPGGIVVIHDFILDRSGTGPLFPVLFSLNMLLGTCEGSSYSERELKDWLLEVGFKKSRTVRLNKDSALVVGEK